MFNNSSIIYRIVNYFKPIKILLKKIINNLLINMLHFVIITLIDRDPGRY